MSVLSLLQELFNMTAIILTKLTTQGIRSGVWQNKVKVNLQQQGSA